ncbi:hypothetical protein ACFOY5_16105 [Massilia aurea]|jgi:hypothetical protein|uniref:hypothetical protein n=1 Tax=Massilia aurea TaxID=373040 RepID=UPI002162FF17|nr:hypothetical protein [Massilia aurea]MCS0706280.1 hypothetical protein [Massilia aurea]
MNYRQAGHTSLEYVIVCAALAFALFVPISGDAASPEGARSTLKVVLDIFKQSYRDVSHAISLPN